MMKKDWTIKKLGELVTTINGLWKGKKPPFVNVAVIRNTNFSKDCQLKLDDVEYLDVEEKQFKTRQLHMGDIIIEKSGGSEKQPVGRPILFNIQDDNYSFSNFTSTLRINNQEEICSTFLQQYLYHRWLEGDTKSLQSHTTGIHNLDFKGILNFDIPIPPLEEQKRIVAVLDKKFAQIETLKTAAEKNLQNTKQLFQAELSKTFNDKDLEKKKLSDLCELISGYAFDSKGYTSNDEDTLLICGDNIMHCSFRWETIKRWPKEQYEELKRFELKESDIVLAMDRPWIKSGLKISKITDNELPSLLVQRTAAIRTSSKVLSEYLYYALQEESFSKYLVDQQTGVGVPHISGKQILNYEVGIPISTDIRSEDSNLCNIVSHLESLSEKVHQLEEIYTKQLADCDELKQSLLQKAFDGEL